MAETAQAAEASTQAPKDTRLVYEVGFHIVPTVGDEGVGAVVEKIRAAIGEAEVIKESAPTKMTVAYTIERSVQGKREKYTQTYFGWIKFALAEDADRAQVAALQEKLRGMSDVLRYLVIGTVREDVQARQRAVFASDRLEGKTLEKPAAAPEKPAEVSQEELDKSIEALTG